MLLSTCVKDLDTKQAGNRLRLLNSHPLYIPYWKKNRLRILIDILICTYFMLVEVETEDPFICKYICFRFYWHLSTYFYWIVCGFYEDSTFACKYSYCDWILSTPTYSRRCSIIGSLYEGKKKEEEEGCSLDHCIVYPSIYGFWWDLRYLQTLFNFNHLFISFRLASSIYNGHVTTSNN